MALERVREAEWLDADAGSAEEVASALRSLRLVNRLFGGNRMHQRLLRRVWPSGSRPSFHVLEAASGRADVLQSALVPLMRRRPVDLRLTVLDRNAQHLPPPAAWSPELPQPERLVADALHMPLPDKSVDVVSCCLFLHHLDEDGAHAFIREALRVARVGLLINDLERTPLHHRLSRLFSLVDPSRLSRHDGPVSVRQAYTREELASLLRDGGSGFHLERGWLFRLGAIVWSA